MTQSDNARRVRLEELRAEVKVVRDRMQDDSDYLDKLRSEINRVRRQVAEPGNGKGPRKGDRDILVVDAGLLGDIIYEWANARPENQIINLSVNAGVNARSIRGFKNREQRTVGLDIAEKLLIAMGLEHLLGDTLPIIDNPTLSLARIEQRKREETLEELTGY